MTFLILVAAIQWFEALVSNVLVKPYEIGFWPIGDFNTTTKQWWTNDVTQMIHFDRSDISIAFFIGGFLKWHYILSMTTVLIVLSLERSFACYFLNDYEKKTRNCLLFCIVFGYHSITLFATFCFFFNAAHFAFGMAYILSPNVVAVAVFFYTRNFNLKVTRAIEDFSNSHNYSLAARFQARENIRCFQMISNVITAAVCIILLACFFNLIIFMEWAASLDTLWNLLFENLINLNPLLIYPTLLLSVDAWRKFSLSHSLLSRLKVRRAIKVSTFYEALTDGKREVIQKETETYFDQLKTAWT